MCRLNETKLRRKQRNKNKKAIMLIKIRYANTVTVMISFVQT